MIWRGLFLKLTKWPLGINRFAARIAIIALDLYRSSIGLSLGGQCRFYPSCSAYARKALQKHGLFKGLFLTSWRLVRCNPFNPGGVDEP